MYAWFVISLILVMAINNQWQRYMIAYAKGFVGEGDKKGDPKYEISAAYPDLNVWYGVLSGLAFTASYSVAGLFAGVISDMVNRKVFIGIVGICWSACTFGTGVINSFPLLFVFRFGLGLFESAFNPCAYSMIADYFHPTYRGTANAILNEGIYLGGALASLTTILIQKLGWRGTYSLIGIIGGGFAVATFLLTKEPKRGKFDKKKEVDPAAPVGPKKGVCEKFGSASKEVWNSPALMLTIGAACGRFWAGYALGFFLPLYYGGVYPNYKEQYTYYNLVIHLVPGMISALAGGVIGDYYEAKGYYMAKAWVCIIGTFLGIPTVMWTCLVQNNFWWSINGLFVEYLVAECWIGPAITILINICSPENKGTIVSVFLFFATVSGTISNALLGFL